MHMQCCGGCSHGVAVLVLLEWTVQHSYCGMFAPVDTPHDTLLLSVHCVTVVPLHRMLVAQTERRWHWHSEHDVARRTGCDAGWNDGCKCSDS